MIERVKLVIHHVEETLPIWFEGKKLSDVQDVASTFVQSKAFTRQDYNFLWNREKILRFEHSIVEAGAAYITGNYEVVPESQKADDHICKCCDNLVNGICILQK